MSTVLKELKCPNCGSPLPQHLASTQAIVCSACNTHVKIGGEVAEVLGKGTRIPAPPKPIFPGDKVEIQKTNYFVMGRVLYRGWDPDEPSDRWHWNEWLLGGDNGQLMWLSYDKEAGFVLYRKLRLRAPFDPQKDRQIPLGDDKKPFVTEHYPARLLAAEGELTWHAN